MFDFHTHILPGMDDGSRSIEESLEMLKAFQLQGVDGLAATPHFYAEQMSPETFFARRRNAWEQLRPHLGADAPEIRLGAEVRYFEGIARYDNLAQFCLEGTGLLLLEMPQGRWTNRMIAALSELNRQEPITVLLAHVERYFREQTTETWDMLLKCGIKMQVSADFLIRRCTRRTALKLLRNGRVHLLGSDCHNMTSRKPNLAEAVSILEQKNNRELFLRLQQREALYLQAPVLSAGKTDHTLIGGGCISSSI